MHVRIFENYRKNDRSNLIAILQDIQDLYGYMPEKVLREVSEFVGMLQCTFTVLPPFIINSD